MNASRPAWPQRFERLARGLLALGLIAAVVWALADGGGVSLRALSALFG